MNIFSIIANLIRFGSDFLIPSRKDILQWELEELKKIREEIERKRDGFLEEVPKLIEDAKRKLKLAMEYEPCDLCKDRIKEALMYLNEELEVVERTHRIVQALERLKSRGVISHNKRWDELSPEEKKLVYKEAGLDGRG
ncbi:MAG: hypothetical protein J7M38_10210 [Armatimonadetes bacterium]|nr:hypothetical protein [Armatimonadota bacterium]